MLIQEAVNYSALRKQKLSYVLHLNIKEIFNLFVISKRKKCFLNYKKKIEFRLNTYNEDIIANNANIGKLLQSRPKFVGRLSF